MEYTLQLSDEIALQKDDLATYEGAAFTGEEYYLTVPFRTQHPYLWGRFYIFYVMHMSTCLCGDLL